MNFSLAALFCVASGAVLGALLRYSANVLSVHLWGHRFPWATLLVNVGGCFTAGVLLALLTRSAIADNTRLFWMTGFLGALTTFSAFSVESLAMLLQSDFARAAVNITANLVGSLFAVTAGYVLVKQFI